MIPGADKIAYRNIHFSAKADSVFKVFVVGGACYACGIRTTHRSIAPCAIRPIIQVWQNTGFSVRMLKIGRPMRGIVALRKMIGRPMRGIVYNFVLIVMKKYIFYEI